ncbi:hemolysin secretion protein D, partial [Pseudomonas sp. MPR-R1B]
MPTFLRNRWTWIGAAVVAVIAGIAWMMMASSAAK